MVVSKPTHEDFPAFGSEDFLRRCLYNALVAARAGVDRAHRVAASQNLPEADFDLYANVRLSRRYRKVWKLLEEVATAHSWVRLRDGADLFELLPSVEVDVTTRKNAERPSVEAVVAELRAIGIAASVEVFSR